MGEQDRFEQIVNAATARDVTDTWIADLTTTLAESGDRIHDYSGTTADVPSTGGPSSLSTLLCPLFLAAGGLLVPKLGVPGRPAGGLDIMAQIPGYQTRLDPTDVRAVLDRCRYAHFEAAGRFAPMDGRLFAFRQSSGAQAVIPLVISSLLSKKLAVGVKRVGLDIRVGNHGNFGATFAEANENASRFIRIASLLGISAKAFITNANRPYQPYIGRGEALLALHEWFTGAADPWLSRHIDQCAFMALQLNDDAFSTEPSVIECTRCRPS
jgi:thymidine phosphorylase